MIVRYRWATSALAFSLAVAPLACGNGADDERAALEQDELNRELDLALQGDTAPATFEDTAAGVEPVAEPASPPVRETPRPRPQPRTSPPRREPAPQPAPRPVDPDPAPAPRAPRAVTSSVAVGTNASVTLNETLSTETNRPGDTFTATVQQPILDANGNVVIPAGAVVRGRVTHVQKSGRVGETAVLNLAFESVSFGGERYPMQASVVQADPQRKSRASTGEQVGKAAAGAAAGAILGRVLGKDTKGAIKGAVIGAAAGTAIAMGTADVDAVLPAGSTMIIRIDSPVTITRTVS